jgi:predicted nucleic acid-binding protein
VFYRSISPPALGKISSAGRILPIDGAVADRWGLVAAEAKGSSLSAVDGLLAVTALQAQPYHCFPQSR